MGLSVSREKVLTSGEATAAVLQEKYPGKRAFVLGNEFLLAEMREAGVKVDQADPELVVVGYDTTLDYKKMAAVCDFVRAGLPYIATHPDFNCPTETGFARTSAPSWPLSRPAPAAAPTSWSENRTPASCGRRSNAPASRWADGHGRRPPLYGYRDRPQKRHALHTRDERRDHAEMLKAYPNKPDLVFDRLAEMIPLL